MPNSRKLPHFKVEKHRGSKWKLNLKIQICCCNPLAMHTDDNFAFRSKEHWWPFIMHTLFKELLDCK